MICYFIFLFRYIMTKYVWRWNSRLNLYRYKWHDHCIDKLCLCLLLNFKISTIGKGNWQICFWCIASIRGSKRIIEKLRRCIIKKKRTIIADIVILTCFFQLFIYIFHTLSMVQYIVEKAIRCFNSLKTLVREIWNTK